MLLATEGVKYLKIIKQAVLYQFRWKNKKTHERLNIVAVRSALDPPIKRETE